MTALVSLLANLAATHAAELRRRYPPARLSVADDSTFDRWLALPSADGRTIEEFVEAPNMVRLDDWRGG